MTPLQKLPRTVAAPRSPQFSARWLVALALLICYPLFFFYLGGWGLVDPDEGRYAEVAREMLANHDWVTPTLNSIKFFDKPPLLYWGMAASYAIFGLNEWAARLIPAVAALAGVGMTWLLGRRMFGERAAVLGALMLSTSLMWPVMARFVLTDMLFSVMVFCALGFWVAGPQCNHAARAPRVSRILGGSRARGFGQRAGRRRVGRRHDFGLRYAVSPVAIARRDEMERGRAIVSGAGRALVCFGRSAKSRVQSSVLV